MEPTQALQHLGGGGCLEDVLWLWGAILQQSGISFFLHPKEVGTRSWGFWSSTQGQCFGAGACSWGQGPPSSVASPADGCTACAMGCGHRGVLAASGVEKLPCEPQTGKVELGCGELPGLFTLSLLPPTFLPFSPSSPSPSLSHCSVSHPGSPTTFLPPRLCSSLSMTVTRVTVTHGDVSPADALAAPTEKPSALASCAACSEPGKPLPVH